MPFRITSRRPDPALLRLPWSEPLEEWDSEHVLDLPRGLSRHVVRIVRTGPSIWAVKETQEDRADREYRLLRDLQRLGMPTVEPQAVIAGRTTPDGAPLPTALVTRYLPFSLPYRTLFKHGLTARDLPSLVDALVVLLVRLHLSGFYWGDVSLSNVLFRRDAGAFEAYLVDAETGELQTSLADQMRDHDVTVGCENVFAELLDLEAAGDVRAPDGGTHEGAAPTAHDVVQMLQERYETLWNELTAAEEAPADDLWRVEQRVERLNALGFDVEELDIVTDVGGDTLRIVPRVVELGHHSRELRSLTGMDVQDNQARRLLNDLASFTAAHDLGREDRPVVAARWLDQVYEPLAATVPVGARGKLEPAELFHEVLEHRWYLSEQAGREVELFDAARDYITKVLERRPDELLAGTPGESAGSDEPD